MRMPSGEKNRPKTGSYLDELPPDEIDWELHDRIRAEERRLGRLMTLEEELRFTGLTEEGIKGALDYLAWISLDLNWPGPPAENKATLPN